LTQLYDEIGIGYRDYRRPDSRIYTPILRFLGEARTIVDVGAGTGSSGLSVSLWSPWNPHWL